MLPLRQFIAPVAFDAMPRRRPFFTKRRLFGMTGTAQVVVLPFE